MIYYADCNPISLDAEIDSYVARKHRNHAEVRKWCRQYTLLSSYDQGDWILKTHEDPSIKMFAVKKGEEQAGVCGFTSIDRHNRSAEFSLYIGPEYHLRGYGRKSLKTLLRHGFNDFGFNRIWGETFEGNPALNMFKDLGFKVEGHLRQTYFRSGKFIDSFMIGLLKEDFNDA